MTYANALRLLWPEISARTVDVWNNDDYANEPDFGLIAADVEAGNMTVRVMQEIESWMDTLPPNLLFAAQTILAVNGRLEEWDDTVVSTRPLKKRKILGKFYIVG